VFLRSFCIGFCERTNVCLDERFFVFAYPAEKYGLFTKVVQGEN
jgi:hypothetical protein